MFHNDPMNIRSVAYMEWAKARPAAAVNLSLSGLAGPALADLGIDWNDMALNGEHPYGYPPLLEAIAARHGIDVRNVCPTLGASQGIFSICAALVGPGDAVLAEKPAYEPLLAVPRLLGAEVRRFERKFENGYRVDPDEFRSSLGAGTKLVLMTNPHNPSGVALSREEIRALATIAGERGATLLVDEIYLEFLAGEAARTSFGAAPNIAVTSSLTKVFGLSGLRCGWVLARDGLVSALRKLMDHLFVEQVFIGEQVAAKLFARLDRMKAASKPFVESNFRAVREFMGEEDALEWTEPSPGIIAFPRLRGAADAGELARRLLEDHGTCVVPGRFFEAPRHFRLGFGIPAGELKRGLNSLRAVLGAMSR
jgi:aspartate/methionine/tyrosine aminotransferase